MSIVVQRSKVYEQWVLYDTAVPSMIEIVRDGPALDDRVLEAANILRDKVSFFQSLRSEEERLQGLVDEL